MQKEIFTGCIALLVLLVSAAQGEDKKASRARAINVKGFVQALSRDTIRVNNMRFQKANLRRAFRMGDCVKIRARRQEGAAGLTVTAIKKLQQPLCQDQLSAKSGLLVGVRKKQLVLSQQGVLHFVHFGRSTRFRNGASLNYENWGDCLSVKVYPRNKRQDLNAKEIARSDQCSSEYQHTRQLALWGNSVTFSTIDFDKIYYGDYTEFSDGSSFESGFNGSGPNDIKVGDCLNLTLFTDLTCKRPCVRAKKITRAASCDDLYQLTVQRVIKRKDYGSSVGIELEGFPSVWFSDSSELLGNLNPQEIKAGDCLELLLYPTDHDPPTSNVKRASRSSSCES